MLAPTPQLTPLKRRVTAVLAAALLEALLFSLATPAAELATFALTALLPLEGEAAAIAFELVYALFYALNFLLPTAFLILLLHGKPRSYLPLAPRFRCSPALAVAVTLGVTTAANLLSSLYLDLLDLAGVGIYETTSPFPTSTAAILVYFLSSVIVPAVVEEIAYRGAVLHALLPFGRRFAIIASGILFGVMHFNPAQLLYATAAGIALAYFALEADSLWLTIAIHALNNALSFFGHWLYENGTPYAYYAFYTILDSLVIAAAAVGILALAYHRSHHRRLEEIRSPKLSEAAAAFLSPVGAAYAVAALLLSLEWCFLY